MLTALSSQRWSLWWTFSPFGIVSLLSSDLTPAKICIKEAPQPGLEDLIII